MKSKIFKFVSVLFLLVLVVPVLTGCQSTDKSMSYFDTNSISSSKFNYDNINDRTTVTWTTTLKNNTIYNMEKFSVKFELYNNKILVDTTTYDYSYSVGHGEKRTGNFTFTYNGEINNIKFISWNKVYDTFWNTYKIWIIVSIATVCVFAIIYLLCMIILDLGLEDVLSDISDNIWILLILLLPFGTVIYSAISSNWICSAIVSIAVAVLVILILIFHLIKNIL